MSRLAELPNPQRQPPGPRSVLRNTLSFARTPLSFLGDLIATHGDILSFRLPQADFVLVNHPHYVKHVLQDNLANYTKASLAVRAVEPFMGRGLATVADMPTWRRNRRLVQPAFHRNNLEAIGAIMTAAVDSMIADWEADFLDGRPVTINSQMSRLTLTIIAHALFGRRLDPDEVARFTEAVRVCSTELGQYVKFPFIPLKLPTPGHRRFWRSISAMESVVYRAIRAFSEDESRREGMLALFMQSYDADTGGELTPAELRDEVFTMLFAGHETSSTTLTWFWYELSRNRDIACRVEDEIRSVLGGRPVALTDLPQLTYTRQVLQEALRLYPPTWQNHRLTVADDEIAGYRVPAGTQMLFSTYHLQRHPDFWDDPETFDPERFSDVRSATRDRSCYIPFAAGSRVCIGKEFAMMEMQIIVATVVQRFRVNVVSSGITPKPRLLLDTSGPVVATLQSSR